MLGTPRQDGEVPIPAYEAMQRDQALGRRMSEIRWVLEQLKEGRGLPGAMVMDNEPEFTGKTPDAWVYQRDVHLSLDQGKC